MQNHEEPFHSATYRNENDKIARVLCITVGL